MNSFLLERIASNYDKQSNEYKAIKMSALAYGFSILKHEKEFEAYMDHINKPLTVREEEYLKKISQKEKNT